MGILKEKASPGECLSEPQRAFTFYRPNAGGRKAWVEMFRRDKGDKSE